MQHQIHPPAGALTDLEVPDVTFDELEPPPLRWRDEFLYLLEIPLFAGRKIVQCDDFLAELEQGFHEVRPDEPGAAGDEPGFRFCL